MKDTRVVLRGIGVTDFDETGKNGKYRVVTDPDEIAGMYSQAELDAFVESGVLSADNPSEWKSTKVEEGEADHQDEDEAEGKAATKAASKAARKAAK